MMLFATLYNYFSTGDTHGAEASPKTARAA